MSDDKNIQLPALRTDLKISRQVRKEAVTYIVKDPLKNQFYRFEEGEWDIIALFDGKHTLEQIVNRLNAEHKNSEIDLDTVKGFKESLEQMKLLRGTKRELNIMLVEKMKELRQSFLLSKKGSLFYKRFPIVDPDKFFNKIIPHIGFFWTKWFLIFSLLCMLFSAGIVYSRWDEFQIGVQELFAFKGSSFWGLVLLWVTIYITIGIHEMGHGLSCKYYGGEVHEIGLLLLFFQPCLYANVNDAWLFDKKWKQIIVTIAGGYIEVWVGSLFAIVWMLTNPNTVLNTLSFQVVAICSASTVLFNFNPLVKLDGYYLLADSLEIPNLKDQSFGYIKYLASKYIFKIPDQEFEATRRERRIYFSYGVASFFWMFSLMFGLYTLVKNLLANHLQDIGILVSFGVAYWLFKGPVTKAVLFLVQWFLKKRAILLQPQVKIGVAVFLCTFFIMLFFPVSYPVRGTCVLEPSFVYVIRAKSDGILSSFVRHDGDRVESDILIAKMENENLEYDRRVTSFEVAKLKYKVQDALVNNLTQLAGFQRELETKELELQKKTNLTEKLELRAPANLKEGVTILSCDKEVQKTHSFIKKGDEICRILGIQELKAVIEVTEQEVGYIREQDLIEFKLSSQPFKTYVGKVHRIRSNPTPDPRNPKNKLYVADITIHNPGNLRAGLDGIAKIQTEKISILKWFGRKTSTFLRLDLFL